jgi:hypothetical protein
MASTDTETQANARTASPRAGTRPRNDITPKTNAAPVVIAQNPTIVDASGPQWCAQRNDAANAITETSPSIAAR